jgi:putative membrane protein
VVTSFAIAFVAVIHLLFMVLEMFFWRKPLGRRIFGLNSELAGQTAALAANQGLYNGFLAAGLMWSLTSPPNATAISVFFLICVIVAGVFGAITAKRSILFIQALPGAVALAIVLVSG